MILITYKGNISPKEVSVQAAEAEREASLVLPLNPSRLRRRCFRQRSRLELGPFDVGAGSAACLQDGASGGPQAGMYRSVHGCRLHCSDVHWAGCPLACIEMHRLPSMVAGVAMSPTDSAGG